MARSAANKLEIQELLARSALALDERNVAALEATFAKNAQLSIIIGDGIVSAESRQNKAEPIVFKGREAIMGLMTGSMEEQADLRRHVISNTFFESISADAAEVVSYLLIYAIENGGIRCVSSGIYRDRVVRKKRGWKIARRLIDLDLPY